MAHLQSTWQRALQPDGPDLRPGPSYDGAWLSAGSEHMHFADDHRPRFKPNPHFSQWLDPQFITPESRLLIRPDARPKLFLLQPEDYWHAPAPHPENLDEHFEIETFASADELIGACAAATDANLRFAHIGEAQPGNEPLGESNPQALTDFLYFHRARKTAFELAAMRTASEVGARGHLAAHDAFMAGGTEFDIHMAYLAASKQTDLDLPYGNIVALNEHGSVLHYQFQERVNQRPPASLLIDAGGQYRGYASDITRTYAADGKTGFADLIRLMQAHQNQLIDSIAPGRTFADLHSQMHQQLAQVLRDADLITCSAAEALDAGITETFCPHGLGHLLGLQVHDVGGHLANARGEAAPPPANYPALRFTRAMQTDQVFTIEPGLYFIPMLLNKLLSEGVAVNWATVEELAPYGGIRIEDNVRVLEHGVENLTRDAFARVAS